MIKKLKRENHPLRFYSDDYEKIKAKVVQDKLTFQKLGDILFKAYVEGNEEIDKLVKKYADDKYARKRRYDFTELEAEEILRKLEAISPLQDGSDLESIEEAFREEGYITDDS